MKLKRLLAIASTMILLCSCNRTYEVPPIMGNGGDSGNQSPEKEQEEKEKNSNPIDTYLVLSSIGLYNGEKGKNLDDLMLENVVIYNAKPGTDLPTKDQISVVSGSKGVFDNWVCYEGTGFPTIYTKVPDEAGKILYATFKNSDGSSGGDEPVNPTNPEKLTTIYLDATQKLNGNADDQTWASGGAAVTMFTWSYTTGDSKWIKMNNNGSGFYSANVNLGLYTNVIFLRHDDSKQASFDEGGYWNKTGDLLFVAGKNCFKITSWNDGGVWTNK